jgi:hypothetical protein
MDERRQLILCFDGTNNSLTGGDRDTHVVRLLELLKPESHNQLTYYDPGVGNSGIAPGVDIGDKFNAAIDRIKGLALGGGIYDNIAQGYLFLVNNYRPTDDIFLFGFSRGAFTARSVGGMVARFGLLRPEHAGMIDTLLHLYFSDGAQPGHRRADGLDRLATQVKGLCARQDGPDRSKPNRIPIWFTGVWDTVESVGVPGTVRKIRGSPTILGKAHVHVRHALALDEFRKQFLPRMYAVHPDAALYEEANQSIKQVWFAGSHCDVGGGYESDKAALSRTPLTWLLYEAAQLPQRPLRFGDPLPAPTSEHTNLVIHSELKEMPLWALTGMHIRNPQHNPLKKLPARDARHRNDDHAPAVLSLKASQGADLQDFRFGLLFWWSLLSAFVLFGIHGAVLLKGSAKVMQSTPHEWLEAGALKVWAKLDELSCANWQFLEFQLTAFWSATLEPAAKIHNGMSALAWDFLLILAYAVVVAYLCAWAFGRLAGRRLGAPPTRATHLLNWLGQAPMWLVIADILENLATAIVLADWARLYLPTVVQLVGALMALFAATKIIAFLMCCTLVFWAVVCRPKPQVARPA